MPWHETTDELLERWAHEDAAFEQRDLDTLDRDLRAADAVDNAPDAFDVFDAATPTFAHDAGPTAADLTDTDDSGPASGDTAHA